jgi:hypothetical protein
VASVRAVASTRSRAALPNDFSRSTHVVAPEHTEAVSRHELAARRAPAHSGFGMHSTRARLHNYALPTGAAIARFCRT